MAKWLQISELVFNDLASHEGLTDLLSYGIDSIYPLIADAEEGDAFITYSTDYDGIPTKDASYSFTITVATYAPTYNASLTIADAVTDAIIASVNSYSIRSGSPKWIAENEFYIEQVFTIKK